MTDEADGALTQLRAWLAQRQLPEDGRLPPERELCDLLGVSRGELRKALSILESEGELWRQVGKGTFAGIRPPDELTSVAAIAARSSPAEVMRARLQIETMLAQEAALNATVAEIDEMRRCARAAEGAASWRQYETADNRLHRTVAEAAGNTVLTALFDQLNAVRRAVVWGRRRDEAGRPPANHHSFAEHRRLIEAIADRDPPAARAAMRDHLNSVGGRLLGLDQAAE